MKSTKIFIDKLAVTLPIGSPILKRRISKRLKELDSRLGVTNSRYTGRFISRYGQTYIIEMTGNDDVAFSVFLSIYPVNTAHNFFRCEFNPTAAGRNGLAKLRTLLEYVLGTKQFKRLYDHCSVTRLDLTVDALGLAHDYYVYVKKCTWSEIRFIDGVAISQIVGRGQYRLTLYEKPSLKGRNAVRRTRIECRLRALGCSLATLPRHIDNPFAKVQLIRAKSLIDGDLDEKFVRDTKRRGLNAALHRLGSRNKKARQLAFIQRHQARWFNPGKIWHGWPAALKLLDVLRPDQ